MCKSEYLWAFLLLLPGNHVIKMLMLSMLSLTWKGLAAGSEP